MSIAGAVAELNQEIERLVGIRDSLLQHSPAAAGISPAAPAKKSAGAESTFAKRKPRPKKSSSVKKAAAVKETSAPAKKRTMSPEARKRISEANKKRWAALKKTKA